MEKQCTLFHGSISLGNIACHGGHESDPMLGGGHGVSSGSIDDQTTILSGSGKIHIVDPDAGPSDDLEPAAGGFKDLARDLGAAPHDERVAVGTRNLQTSTNLHTNHYPLASRNI
jgi:hypothetical protein